MAEEMAGLGPADLRAARVHVGRVARVTPLVPSEALGERRGYRVALKCENLQLGGAFKIRGASHFLGRLEESERRRGVVTYSSGNHAIALSLAARRAGVPAVVVMPEKAPAVKVAAVRALGAELHFTGSTSLERQARAEELARDRGLVVVPPFDHPWIIAGQASCGVEIQEQWPEVGAVLVPVGGGGLLAGIALACGYHRAGIRVIGVEPEGAAAMAASLQAGAPVTLPAPHSIADGLLPSRPGDLTTSVAKRFVETIITVSDDAIRAAAAFLLRREHLLVEWSGAVGVAALLYAHPGLPGVPTVAVLSGGNADPAAILAAADAAPRGDR